MIKSSIHDNRVLRIQKCPDLIGLDDIVFSVTELLMYEGNHLVGSVDLVLKSLSSGLIAVEYKCGSDHRNKAFNQLYNTERWFNDSGLPNPHLWYVHGKDYEIEVFK